MIDWLAEPYSYAFMQRALAAAVLVGALAPAVGVWIVLRRMAYLGDAMSHATLGGIALASLAGVSLVVGALGAGLLMAVFITALAVHPRLHEDTIIGITQVALFAAGLLIISRADTGAIDLSHILLGSITTVSAADLRLDLVLGAGAAILLALAFDDLRSSTLDPEHAATVGIPVTALRAVLLAILAIVVVLALQTVGLLLSVALLVVPAATARLWTTTILRMTLLAMALGITATATGLTLSWHVNTPPGATVALLTVLALAASAAATRPRHTEPPSAHLGDGTAHACGGGVRASAKG